MISTCQQLLKQQLLQIQCQSVTDMWMAAADGRTRSRDPVIPSHVPQCDQGKLAQSFPSTAFLSSSPSLGSWVSSLTLGALWFG